MKGKQLLVLLLLAALAGTAWYYLSEHNRGSWSASSAGGGKVVEFPINDVAHLKIKNSTGELNLVKKGETWAVQERADYPANFEQVSGLLRKLWELKTVQEVKVGPSQMPRLELIEPGQGDSAGTLVEFTGADGKTLAALLLGKKYVSKSNGPDPMGMGGFPKGRYVKAVSGTKVSLVSDPLEDAQTKPEPWLAKDFVKVDGPKSIAVAGPTDAQKWTVTRENATAEWKLAGAKPEEKLDTGKTAPLGNLFAGSSFDDVLAPDAKPADTGLDKPTVATIETFDGFRYELKIGKERGAAFPLTVAVSASLPKERTAGKDEKPEDKKKLDEEFQTKRKQQEEKLASEKKFASRIYLVPKMAVESLLKDRTALLPDKPAEPAPAPTAATPPTSAPPAPGPMPRPRIEAATPPLPVPPPAPSAPPVPPPTPSSPPTPPTPPVPPPTPSSPPAPAPVPPAPPVPAPTEKPIPPVPIDKPAPEKPAENPPAKP